MLRSFGDGESWRWPNGGKAGQAASVWTDNFDSYTAGSHF